MKMARTSWSTILGAFVSALMASYAVFVLAQGMGAPTPPATWLTQLFMVAVSLAVFLRGRAVRRMVAGEQTSMTPLEAARVVTAAKTNIVVGSLLAGYFLAAVLFVAGRPPAAVRAELLISSSVGVFLAIVMVGIGVLVEAWCRVDPPEDDEALRGGPGPSAPSAA